MTILLSVICPSVNATLSCRSWMGTGLTSTDHWGEYIVCSPSDLPKQRRPPWSLRSSSRTWGKFRRGGPWISRPARPASCRSWSDPCPSRTSQVARPRKIIDKTVQTKGLYLLGKLNWIDLPKDYEKIITGNCSITFCPMIELDTY